MRTVSSTGIQIAPAPGDHFIARPHCGVCVSGIGRVGDTGSSPTVRVGIVPAAGVEWNIDKVLRIEVGPAPHDHFVTRPDCSVVQSAIGRIGRVDGCPHVCRGIISSTGIELGAAASSAPDDHLAASPHCSMTRSAIRCVCRVSNHPTVCGRIIPAAGVQVRLRVKVPTAPHDHFTTSPYSGMCFSSDGRTGGTGDRPRVCCRIV